MAKILRASLAVGFSLVVLLSLAFFFAPLRARLLAFALGRLAATLPGTLQVEQSLWPSLGAIQLRGLHWRDGTNVLAAADELGLAVALPALLRREVEVRDLTLRGAWADVPALTARLAKPKREEPVRKPRFPRPGALPGLPSVAVHRLELQADSLRWRPGQSVTGIAVEGSFEMRHGRVPRLRLLHARAASPKAGWNLAALACDVDLERGTATGRGRGQLQPEWPVFFSVQSSGPDRFTLRLADEEGAGPPERPGILATVDVVRQEGSVEAVAWRATLGLPGSKELARIPALAAGLHGKPELPRLHAETQGRLTLRPRPALQLGLETAPNALVRSGRFTLAGADGNWNLACEELQLTDLRLAGQLQRSADSVVTSLEIDMHGKRALEALGLSGLPELELQARARAGLRRGTSTAAVDIDAHGSIAGHAVQRLLLTGQVQARRPAQAALVMRLESRGLQAGLATEIGLDEGIRARLGPLVVAEHLDAAELVVPERHAGTLHFERQRRELELQGLRLRGDAGEARVDLQRDAHGRGRYAARLTWPFAPPLLGRFLGTARLDSLRARWHIDAPYTVELAGNFAPGKTSLTAVFSLPGPRTLAPFLPAQVRNEDLGPLAGSVHLETAPDAAGPVLRVELEAGRTAWIDTLHVRAVRRGATLHLERALLVLAGTRLALAGELSAAHSALRARLDVPDSALVHRFLRAPEPPALRCSAEATLNGPLARPRIEATLQTRIAAAGYRIPVVNVEMRRDSTASSITVVLPQGAETAWMQLDSAQARVTTGATTFPARLTLRANGPGMELQQTVRLAADSLWSAQVETLRLGLGGKDLHARNPFQVVWGTGRLRLEDLALAGTLGSMEAHGEAGTDSTHVTTRLDLVLPERPASLSVPVDFWPRRLRLELEARSPDVLRTAGELQGFRLAGGGLPALRFDVQARAGRAVVAATLADSSVSYLDADAALPLRFRLYPPMARLEAGVVSGTVRFAALPFALRGGSMGHEGFARVGGNLYLRGTTEAVAGFTDIRVTAPDSPRLASLGLELLARTGTNAEIDSLWQAAGIQEEMATPAGPACSAVFRLSNPTATLVHGSASYPGSLSLYPPGWRRAAGPVSARLRADDLALSLLDPFLRGASLAGSLALSAAMDGPVENPSLNGQARTPEVELTLSDGSRVILGGELLLAGEREQPRLAGEIAVKTGLIKVPEPPKNLHPTTGEALLRGGAPGLPQRAETAPPIGDGSAAGTAVQPAGAGPSPTLARTNLDIGIVIPGAFWLRGRGLDLELAGTLRIRLQQGSPNVVGELRVVRGTYTLLGRTFNLDRGVVTFLGDDTMRPRLDIQLSTTVSTTKIRVFLSGTTEKPEITLSSDPEMEQTDIVTLLAVGKTFDQVSDEESGLLRERATAVLLSVGAAALQENVSSQLGIDVVQYRSTGGAPTGSGAQGQSGSLAFGKYISPRLLLSYSYALDRATDDLVSVEYFLRGELRIETLYSVGGQTGLGFGWTKEY